MKVRYWDLAASQDSGDWTAGVRMSSLAGIYYVEHVIRGQWSAHHRNKIIQQIAAFDGVHVMIWVPQDPGSGGKEAAEILLRELAGYIIRAEPVTGDKLSRAGPFAAQAEAGNVKLVRGQWNEDYLAELHGFPDGGHDDQVDASSGAFNKLALGAGQPRELRLTPLGVGGRDRPVPHIWMRG